MKRLREVGLIEVCLLPTAGAPGNFGMAGWCWYGASSNGKHNLMPAYHLAERGREWC